jgi:hypothetical protein
MSCHSSKVSHKKIKKKLTFYPSITFTQIDEFCRNPVIDGVFRPNQKCRNCIYLFSEEYYFHFESEDNQKSDRFSFKKATVIKKDWNEIETPIDSVISLNDKSDDLIFIKVSFDVLTIFIKYILKSFKLFYFLQTLGSKVVANN